MRILLTNNEAAELESCDIGLGYLAAGLIREGHDVRLLLSRTDEKGFRSLLEEFKPDIVGIKVLTAAVLNTKRTIGWVRAVRDCVVVIGGPHVTADPHEVLDYIPADYAFQGEADRSFPRFVSQLKKRIPPQAEEPIAGMIYRNDGAVVVTPPDRIQQLDELPFPAWELMPPARFQSLVCKRPPVASILTTRGCTHRCAFCAEANKPLRHRSVDNVVAEIKHLAERFGVREIQFLDSNFLFSKQYVISLCQAIRQSGLQLAFCAPNGMRLEALDDEVCHQLARIGFYRANIGIESGSEEVLDRVHKRTSPRLFPGKIGILRKHGIHIIGNFILGFPDETKEEMEQTLHLALSLDILAANFLIYTPYPGTSLCETLVREGRLKQDKEFHDYNAVAFENNLSALSTKELRRFRDWCVFRFLFRWRTLRSLWMLLASRQVTAGSLLRRVYGMYIERYFRRHAL